VAEPAVKSRGAEDVEGVPEGAFGLVEPAAGDAEVGRAPQGVDESPPVARPAEEISRFADEAVGLVVVARDGARHRETGEHEADAAPVAQPSAHLEGALAHRTRDSAAACGLWRIAQRAGLVSAVAAGVPA